MSQLLNAEQADSLCELSDTSRKLLANVSVVVPIGPGDTAWRRLLPGFACLSPAAEVLLVGTEQPLADFPLCATTANVVAQLQWLTCEPGRAKQMNFGAQHANREHLWFVHADSQLSRAAVEVFDNRLKGDSLWYFNLKFDGDGPLLTRLNAWGVRLRSRVLKLPFGDQALCLRRETFNALGGFNQSVAYGEDHLLVWAARRVGMPLRCVDATLTTSARRYTDGWLRTTATHLFRTARQALPEWWKLVRKQK